MKNTKTNALKKYSLLAITLAVVIGFSFAACDTGGDGGGGQGGAPSITTSALQDGVVNIAYNRTLAATGDAPVTWSIASGVLPAGLQISESGAISGTPTTAGTSKFTVKAANSAGNNTKEFSIIITPLGGNPNVDTADLNAVILDAGTAKIGIETASNASEVAVGKKWVTQSAWDAFDDIYKTAAETKANPSSQSAVNTAKTNLEAAIVTFNAAKRDGSAAAITLSGTITVKKNGEIVPYVVIQPHDDNWNWDEYKRVQITVENTPWSISTKPFSADIGFIIVGYDNAQYENIIFQSTVAGLRKTINNASVSNININLDLSTITVSGTLNLDYNGQVIPSVRIGINRKSDGFSLGARDFVNVKINEPWSMEIPPQTANTDVVFDVVGFAGPKAYEYDQLFALWGQDFGVKVGSQPKSDIPLNLITISGTVNVTYKGSPVPIVELTIWEGEWDDWGWKANKQLPTPSANTPWSFVLPAYASNTKIWISVEGKDENDEQLFWRRTDTQTVRNANVSGIALNFIELSGTVNVTYKGNRVPTLSINVDKKVGEDDGEWIGGTQLQNPSANAPWSIVILAFTSDTEIIINSSGNDANDQFLFWTEVATRTVKDTNVSGIELDLGDITE
jgi:hypothetical protein